MFCTSVRSRRYSTSLPERRRFELDLRALVHLAGNDRDDDEQSTLAIGTRRQIPAASKGHTTCWPRTSSDSAPATSGCRRTPTASTPPHDILAAEEFAMLAGGETRNELDQRARPAHPGAAPAPSPRSRRSCGSAAALTCRCPRSTGSRSRSTGRCASARPTTWTTLRRLPSSSTRTRPSSWTPTEPPSMTCIEPPATARWRRCSWSARPGICIRGAAGRRAAARPGLQLRFAGPAQRPVRSPASGAPRAGRRGAARAFAWRTTKAAGRPTRPAG